MGIHISTTPRNPGAHRRAFMLLVVLGILLLVCWLVFNADYLEYRYRPQYDLVQWNLNWKTDPAPARAKALRSNRQLLIVFLKPGTAAGDELIRWALKDRRMKALESNYVLLLAESGVKDEHRREVDAELRKRYHVADAAALLIVADPQREGMPELRRISFEREMPSALLDKIAGGPFVAQKNTDRPPRWRSIGEMFDAWSKTFRSL